MMNTQTVSQPSRRLLKTLHPLAGALAMLAIGSFFTASVLVEVFGNLDQVAMVKHMILYGLALLIPALMTTGMTGFKMVGKIPSAGPLSRKAKRMKWVAANGLLILLPSAIVLDYLAGAGNFTSLFYGIQSIELVAGATNLTLMALNMRDGLRLSKKGG